MFRFKTILSSSTKFLCIPQSSTSQSTPARYICWNQRAYIIKYHYHFYAQLTLWFSPGASHSKGSNKCVMKCSHHLIIQTGFIALKVLCTQLFFSTSPDNHLSFATFFLNRFQNNIELQTFQIGFYLYIFNVPVALLKVWELISFQY